MATFNRRHITGESDSGTPMMGPKMALTPRQACA